LSFCFSKFKADLSCLGFKKNLILYKENRTFVICLENLLCEILMFEYVAITLLYLLIHVTITLLHLFIHVAITLLYLSLGDVNECLSNPCSAEGTASCVQLVNAYRCDCKPGYYGTNCHENTTLCEVSPCLHGGTCSDTTNRYLLRLILQTNESLVANLVMHWSSSFL